MKKKHKDLQPWLDYFGMLQTYKQRGFLELLPEKHEAFITLPALLTMTPGGDSPTTLPPEAIPDTVRHIRAYAAFCAQQGDGYLTWPFALHVVQDEPPHDLLRTILLSPTRSWRTLWRTREKVEVIDYGSEKREMKSEK